MTTKAKREMFAHVAALGRAFANPVRVEIVDLLVQAPRNVEALATLTGQSHANMSQHLQHLRAAGVVRATRDGKAQIYALADDVLSLVYLYLSAAADRVLAAAQRTRAERYAPLDPEPPVPLAQLPQRLRDGAALLVDVRPAAEFAHLHIPGAVSAPVDELAARLATLPRDRDLITYCRGPHCTYAYEALDVMRGEGLRAHRLEGGFLAWRTCEIEKRRRTLACP